MLRTSKERHLELVNQLVAKGVIRSNNIANVMRNVDRGMYSKDSSYAYQDRPHGIGYSQTISAPHMHAWCLEQLEDVLFDGANVLDVGCGSGYLSVCMGIMVSREKKGKVYAIDVVPELVEWAKKNVQNDRPELLEDETLTFVAANGWNGYAEGAPFDAIHVGAAAASLPVALVDQLRPGGKLVIPVGDYEQNMLLVTKDNEGNVKQEKLLGVRYVPLVNKEPSPCI